MLKCSIDIRSPEDPFTRIVSVLLSVIVMIKVYHCANGNEPFDGQIGFGTYSVIQCKFDGDGDGEGICKWTFKRTALYSGVVLKILVTVREP